jgi:hypothetical protein
MTQLRSHGIGVHPAIVAVLIGLAVSCLSGPGAARGATLPSQILAHINAHTAATHPTHLNAEEVQDLKSYLAQGPTYWASHPAPRFPNSLILANRNGTLLHSPAVTYLTWKRAQDPVLFDWRHPRIAPLFQQASRSAAQTLASAQQLAQSISQASHTARLQILTPTTDTASHAATGTTGSVTKTGTPATSAEVLAAPVPEPASVATTLLLFGAAGAWCRRRRTRA